MWAVPFFVGLFVGFVMGCLCWAVYASPPEDQRG